MSSGNIKEDPVQEPFEGVESGDPFDVYKNDPVFKLLYTRRIYGSHRVRILMPESGDVKIGITDKNRHTVQMIDIMPLTADRFIDVLMGIEKDDLDVPVLGSGYYYSSASLPSWVSAAVYPIHYEMNLSELKFTEDDKPGSLEFAVKHQLTNIRMLVNIKNYWIEKGGNPDFHPQKTGGFALAR